MLVLIKHVLVHQQVCAASAHREQRCHMTGRVLLVTWAAYTT
jgi:hypothetical protein